MAKENVALNFSEHSTTKRLSLLCRLDEPCHPSTRLSPLVPLKGWFEFSGEEAPEEFNQRFNVNVVVEVLGDQSSQLRQLSAVSGEIVSTKRNSEFAYLESIEIAPQELPVEDLHGEPSRRRFVVSGVLNVEALIPADGEETKRCFLTLIFQDGAQTSVSNSVEIALPPRKVWKEAYGGFLFPQLANVCSEFMVLQGWAVKKGDPVKEVEIFINGSSAGVAKTHIWSPEIALSFPDTEESKACVFSKTLFRSELKKSLRPSSSVFRAHAVCRYLSGFEKILEASDFRWEPTKDRSPVLEGEIERVKQSPEGAISISGWFFTTELETPRFFLRGFRKTLEIGPGVSGVNITFLKRPDIELERLYSTNDQNYGFEITLHPLVLGRFNGTPLIEIVSENKRRILSPRHLQNKIGMLCKRYFYYRNIFEKVGVTILSFLTRIGIRRGVPRSVKERSLKGAPALLFATHNLSLVEGAPKVLAEVIRAKALNAERAPQMVVVSPRDGALRQVLEEMGVRVVVIPELDVFNQSWERYFQGLRILSEIFKKLSPHLVVANVIDSFWGVDIAKLHGVPALWIIHESVPPLDTFYEIDPRLKIRFLQRLSEVNRCVFVAKSTEALFSQYLESPGVVIPNGVDLSEIESKRDKLSKEMARSELHIPLETTVISIIGTTTRRKGQDIFLREMKYLKAKNPEKAFLFYIVGAREIDFLNELRLLVKEYGLEAEVRFIPETPHVEPYYIASDVLVIASREESAPLVSLEAFAYGVPLATTNVFGLSEQVEHKQNAVVFDGEKDGDLCKAVSLILEDPDLRERLIQGGKKDAAEKFSLQNSVQRYWKEIEMIKNAT